MTTPTGLPDCPLCDWEGDAELRTPVQPAPAALAAALGSTPELMALGWDHERRVQLEREISDHYRTHPTLEWALALLQARKALHELGKWPL